MSAMLESTYDTSRLWAAINTRYHWENAPLIRTIVVDAPTPLSTQYLMRLLGDSPVPYMRITSAATTEDGKLHVTLSRVPFSGAA